MSKAATYFSRSGGFLRKYGLHVLFVVALLLFAASFIKRDYNSKLKNEASQVERALQRRQKVAASYTELALAPEMDLSRMEDLPEDIVIYRYNNDTLQYWFHQFPIGNDKIEAYPFSYRLQYLSSDNRGSTPLAYLSAAEQFVNLGSGWYVVSDRLSEDRRIRVLTGIFVRTEYPSERIPDESNPKLSLGSSFTTAEITEGSGAVVKGSAGEPLFSIVPNDTATIHYGNINLRWLAIILAVCTAVPVHCRRKTWKTFGFAAAVLLLARLGTYLIGLGGQMPGQLFSPILYADSRMVSSLGSLLVNNVLISLAAYSLFAIRDKIAVFAGGGKLRRLLTASVLAVLSAMLVVYIILVIRSLALNSNIALEFFRIADFDIYSIVCYITLAMLLLALLYMLQMLLPHVWPKRSINLFSWRIVVVYAVIVAMYCTTAIGVYYMKKEADINRVRTNKLAIERDVPLELYLRQVESAIANDRFIAVLTSVNGADLIKSRLIERYLNNDIIQKYNVKLSVCNSQSLISLGENVEPVGCYAFYEDMVADYGVALDPTSNIFYLDNFNGLTSYIGVFTYIDAQDYSTSRLFLEIESKAHNDVVTNPIDYITSNTVRQTIIPSTYSYARYSNGRLVSYGGNYDYPVSPPDFYRTDSYSTVSKKGYVHFVNKISDGDLTIVSRRRSPFIVYVISFSYLLFIFGVFFLLLTSWGRTDKMLILPRRSMRRKFTVLIMTAMLVTLVCTGIGSVMHVINLNRRSGRRSMEGKIEVAQKSLTPYCQYAIRYKDLDSPELFEAMESISKVSHDFVNIYDTQGNLVRTTMPEIFEQSLAGRKINDKAFNAIYREGAMRYIAVESIAGVSFYALYAPLFNNDGNLVAIVDVPYFERNGELGKENMSTISAVINLYLVLLIAAVILSIILSNSVSKPLDEIKHRLEGVGRDDSQEDRHIMYKAKNDELAMLVESYNKMVDDLEESKKRLAQNEREQAWKEMARQIAHEIKNPLTPMRLSIQYLMRMKEAQVPGWEDKLEKISKSLLEQIDTLSETASAFSSYSRFFSEDVSDVDLDELIREESVLFDNREDINVEYIQDAENPVVEARRSQISRVMVNLITNAVQAIDSTPSKGGRIKIMLSEEPLDGRKGYKITVEDDGPGVREENIGKLFAPNFTTKTAGTGLGLAISESIIEQSGGRISYSQSQLLGGACFTILLPAK